MKIPRFITISATLLFLPNVLTADDRKLQNAAYQASVEQEQVRAQTRRLVADISAMLEEFRKNPAATEEVKLTQTTLEKLQALSDADMSAVATAMREASKTTGDTGAKILAANKTAKEIQVDLARLADKLALYQDEASLELRLTALVRRQLTNQRQTKYLLDGVVTGGERDKEAGLAAVEQKAIGDETDSLLQSLLRLIASPAGAGKTALAAAQSASVSAQLAPNAQQAASQAATKDFPNTHASQAKVVSALQAMLLALSADKPLEERYRAAEQKMRSLATREQALARTTTKAGLPQQRAITLRQQEIADQRALVEREIAQLSPDTAALLGQTGQTMETLDSTLQKEAKLLDGPDQKLKVVDTQNGLAKNFQEIADMLKKKGDAVASASSSGQGNSSKSVEALSKAATSVMDAIGNMDMAKDLLNRGGDANAAKDQMAKAQGNLDNATKQLGEAGNASPQGAGENVKKSSESLGKGEAEANQGGPGQKANTGLGEARDFASKALADMQKTLSAMNGESQMLAGMQAQGAGQPTEGSGSGGGWGSVFKHTSDFTSFSAQATISEKDRAALSMLQREKAPPEYDTMAQQYLKNLADGVVPVQ